MNRHNLPLSVQHLSIGVGKALCEYKCRLSRKPIWLASNIGDVDSIINNMFHSIILHFKVALTRTFLCHNIRLKNVIIFSPHRNCGCGELTCNNVSTLLMPFHQVYLTYLWIIGWAVFACGRSYTGIAYLSCELELLYLVFVLLH